MKKLLLKVWNVINSFIGDVYTPEEEAAIILRYLLLKNDTVKSLTVFAELEIQFKKEMKQRQIEADTVSKLVNEKYPKCKTAAEITVKDPVFLAPIQKN